MKLVANLAQPSKPQKHTRFYQQAAKLDHWYFKVCVICESQHDYTFDVVQSASYKLGKELCLAIINSFTQSLWKVLHKEREFLRILIWQNYRIFDNGKGSSIFNIWFRFWFNLILWCQSLNHHYLCAKCFTWWEEHFVLTNFSETQNWGRKVFSQPTNWRVIIYGICIDTECKSDLSSA